MNETLLRANVLIGIVNLMPIDEEMVKLYMDISFAIEDRNNEDQEKFMMMVCTLANNSGFTFDETAIFNYVKPIVKLAAEYTKQNYTDDEVDLICDYIVYHRLLVLSENRALENTLLTEKMLKLAKALGNYVNRDYAMFYTIYMINEDLLFGALCDLPKNRAIAYEIANRMNKYEDYYNSVSFNGKK